MCSEFFSTDAVNRKSSSSEPNETISLTPNCPMVSVPVLSKTMVFMSFIISKAFLSLMRIPLFAVIDVDKATTRGIASPRAWGQAITRTVTERVSANWGFPKAAHTI